MRLIIPLPKLQIDTLPFWNCCCSVTKLCPTLCGHMDCSPHGLQFIRIPYPSPSPRVCSNSCPLSQWCHPTSSYSVAPFSFCLQSFPASGSFSSVQFSHSVVSKSLRPHGLLHTRLPCPSPTSRACSGSCPSSRWCLPTTSSSVMPFSSCLQSFTAAGSFPMSQFFISGGQSIGVSASASVLPMNIQDWFPLGLTGWISLQSMGVSRVFSNTTVQKHQFFGTQPSLWSNSYIHTWPL